MPLFLALLLLVPTSAAAQSGSENLSFMQRVGIYRACKPDLEKLCPEAGTRSEAVSVCLRQNQNRLSPRCVTTIREAGVR
jgi:hypothetical protein